MHGDDLHQSWKMAELIEALRLLAAPFEEQVDVLPDFVGVASEIALSFDDAYEVLDVSSLQPVLVAHLERIDSALDQMSADPHSDFWTLASLGTSPVWIGLRQEALAALQSIGLEYARPHIDQGRYVPTEPP